MIDVMMEVVLALYIGRYMPWLEFKSMRLSNALFGVVGCPTFVFSCLVLINKFLMLFSLLFKLIKIDLEVSVVCFNKSKALLLFFVSQA